MCMKSTLVKEKITLESIARSISKLATKEDIAKLATKEEISKLASKNEPNTSTVSGGPLPQFPPAAASPA